VATLTAGCLHDVESPVSAEPYLDSVRATVNPHNALSTVVTFASGNVDSARVVYSTAGDVPAFTPCYRVQGGTTSITTLGLRGGVVYTHQVVACGTAAPVASASLDLATGDLTASLQDVALSVSGLPTPGYTLTTVTRDSNAYVVAFDTAGEVRWYRSFPAREGEFALEAKQHRNGNFTVFVGATRGWDPAYGRYFEITPDGQSVRTYTASVPYYTDNHELLLTFDDTGVDRVHLFGYDLRRVDLTAFGGLPNTLLAGHQILRQRVDGAVEFFWNAWDHLALEDWIEPPAEWFQLPNIDFDHPNSLDIDRDGNYIVSFRNLGEVTKIDAVTGRILWRFGGRNNQFTIVNDPLGFFSAQHCARVLDNGNLLLYDNGSRHAPPESRAVEYRLDTSAMTATMVWQYRPSPPIFTPFVGSVERFENGNTLVGFGNAARVTEVAPDASVVWEGALMIAGAPAPFFYRALKVRSLYEYQRP